MIQNMRIKNVATYDHQGAELKSLGKINFIYGSNGSGKTTISEVIRNIENYRDCQIDWYGTPYKTLVYNRNFIKENFRDDSRIKGIFTLGKESAELIETIEKKKESIDKHNLEISSMKENLGKMKEEQIGIVNAFRENCWGLKTKYDSDFKEAFEGLRNSRDKFMERCLKEANENDRELLPIEELRKRKESVFSKEQQHLELVPTVKTLDSIINIDILKTKIIGKEDVDIAALISRLNISDWVQQGHMHSKNSKGVCPFCQQKLPENFNDKLNEYFNDTYTQQLKELERVSTQYQEVIQKFVQEVNLIKAHQSQYFNFEKVAPIVQAIESTFNENKILLEQKLKEPSRSITLTSVQPNIDKINEELEAANQSIEKHNELLKNLKLEQSSLIMDIWRFIVEENKTNYDSYKKENTRLEKAITGFSGGITKKKQYKNLQEDEIKKLEEQITSIAHSINEINRILSSYGFTNFKLADSGKGNYKIIRGDGRDAEATLSEGEKTFITFLYFYHLIRGSNSTEQITVDKVIVIDDPISSLDSNILFIVSSLIRKLIDEIREDKHTNYKQLIILTHNVFFHKEVSFNKGKGTNKLKDETFWIVRKINNKSCLTKYDENPIKTSYELLWKELQYIKHENLITAQNVMRRILENYFKFFGNLNIDEEVDKFAEEDRFVCKSLLSWANDGSHHVNEDLFIESSPEQTERFLNVFKTIFYNMGHGSHYEMMMAGCETEPLVSEKSVG